MINGAHIIIYSKDAEADKRFIKDTLKFKYVDVNKGWLIFKLPPAEVAVHPSDENDLHEFYLMILTILMRKSRRWKNLQGCRATRSRNKAGVVLRVSNCPGVEVLGCTSRVTPDHNPRRSSKNNTHGHH